MGHRLFTILIVLAIVLFIWSALLFTEFISFGTAGFLVGIALAALAAAQFHLCGHPISSP